MFVCSCSPGWLRVFVTDFHLAFVAGRTMKMLISGAWQASLMLLLILGVSDLNKPLTTNIKLWRNSYSIVCSTDIQWFLPHLMIKWAKIKNIK